MNKHALFRFDLSFNQIIDDGVKIKLNQNQLLRFFYIDVNFIAFFTHYKNDNIVKKYESHSFIKSLFILTKDNIYYLNCSLIFSFLKRNIHLNLFYGHQIERFLTECNLFDFILNT